MGVLVGEGVSVMMLSAVAVGERLLVEDLRGFDLTILAGFGRPLVRNAREVEIELLVSELEKLLLVGEELQFRVLVQEF